MASEAGASPPDTPVMAAGSSGSAVPLDALSAVLESFISRFEVAYGCKGGKKCPLPPPSSGENSDPDSGPAVACGPCLDGLDDAAPDLSDSEEESSVLPHEKALVGALITAVRDTLKIEDTAGASAEVSVPFLSHKLVRTAKVFPYLAYFYKFIYKDWEPPQRSFSVLRWYFGALPL